MDLRRLTTREEEVMHILWRLKKAFVKEILAEMNDPAPPYNTISSVVRKLSKEGMIGHEEFGNTHRYYPILKLTAYRKWAFKQMFRNYFSSDPASLVTHFVKEEDLSPEEIKEIIGQLKKSSK